MPNSLPRDMWSRNASSSGPSAAENAVGWFRAYVSVWVALIGISGNLVVVAVFRGEKQRSRFSIYCMSLAGLHALALLANSFVDDFLGRGLLHLSNYTYSGAKLDLKSDLLCKLVEYVPNAAYLASSWLVIVFSCDRILTLFRPLRFMSLQHQSCAWASSGAVAALALLLNCGLLVIYERQVDPQHGLAGPRIKCDIARRYRPTDLAFKYCLYLKVVGAFVVPNLLVLAMNVVICSKLWRLQVTRCKLLPPLATTASGAGADPRGGGLEMSRVIGHLALSSCFILLTMPLVVLILLRIHSDLHDYKRLFPAYHDRLKHLSRLFSSVKDINYASDFFLCVAFLPNFRWKFLRYACRACRDKSWFRRSRWGQLFEHNVHRFDSSLTRRKLTASCNPHSNVNMELRAGLLERSLSEPHRHGLHGAFFKNR